MTKDGLPGEASQEGQSRPVSLAGLVLVLCVALMGVMGVSITLPIPVSYTHLTLPTKA